MFDQIRRRIEILLIREPRQFHPGRVQPRLERTRSRGHVNWMLAGFFVQADAPPPMGEKLFLEGKEIGEITSACISPTLRKTIALGYVRREASDPGTRLAFASGSLAEVTQLPFYRARS